MDKPPGSKVAYSFRKLHHFLGTSYSFFAVVTEENFIIEYVKKPGRRYRGDASIVESSSSVLMSESFFEKCALGKAFYWPSRSNTFQLERYLPIDELDPSGANFFLIMPVLDDSVPIALFIYVFSKNIIFYDSSMFSELLHASCQSLMDSVRYLFQRRSQKMIVNPIYSSRETRINDRKIFVLMPFTESWSDRIWHKYIYTICVDCQMFPVRSDDLFGRDIMEDVWKEICNSKIIIADITNRNPNVFYELGIAHTLGKPVILLTQNAKDIPFDLNRYRHIIYEDNADGYEILEKDLKKFIGALK